MKKTGFTLVELLGIIIIIAIIALIGVPSVVEIINSAKEGTMKQSVRSIVHAAETLYKEEMLENGGKTPKIKFEDLTYKGEQFEYGSLSYNKDQTANVAVWKNGTCAYKTSSDKDVVLTKDLSEEECLAKGNNKLIVNKDYMLKDWVGFRDKIGEATEFVFTDIEVPTGVTTEDLSTTGNGKVLGWLDGTTYYVSSGVEGQVIFSNEIAHSMFSNCKNLISIDLSNFDTSQATDMGSMFSGCTNLTILDVSDFDTTNVTNMGQMFLNCSNLTILDVSNFETSKVTSMSGMFDGCTSLTILDLSNFDTSNVKSMLGMFQGCGALTTLDVSNFNTLNVTEMAAMFNGCRKLASLDVSGFDTSKVSSMSFLFRLCENLTTLDLSNFDTTNVTDMYTMFDWCKNLTTIYVGSKWSISNVTSSHSMFASCTKLPNFNSSYVDKTKAYAGDGGYLTLKS